MSDEGRGHDSRGAQCAVSASTVTVGVGAPARAHHSFAAEFDAQKPLTLKGTVTKLHSRDTRRFGSRGGVNSLRADSRATSVPQKIGQTSTEPLQRVRLGPSRWRTRNLMRLLECLVQCPIYGSNPCLW